MRSWIIAAVLVASGAARADEPAPSPLSPPGSVPAEPVLVPVPVLVPAPVSAPPPAPACRSIRPYLEPTYFLGGGEVALHRLAAGVVFRECSTSERPLHVRLGPSIHVASDALVQAAYGLEVDVGLLLSPVWRAGLRLGYETGARNQSLGTVGLRFRAADLLVLGIDVYRASSRQDEFPIPPLERRWGVMAGFGFEGKVGTAIAIAEALLVAGAIALAPPS